MTLKSTAKSTLEKLPFYDSVVLPYHYAQSILAGLKYHHPGKSLHVIAVTGTNGKTTTCFMIWHLLNSAGLKAGLMTTVAWGVDNLTPELNHMTTVDSFTLNRRIQEIKNKGADYLVLEVTSHALAEFRTLGLPIEVAVFTNLTHDHLDYHRTFARYRAAKGKLFKKAAFSIINADDPNSSYFQQISKNYITYGIKNGENRAKSVKLAIFDIKYAYGDINISVPIPGEFNVYNSLAAALVGQKYGLTPPQIQNGLSSIPPVEGRMNIIDEGQPFTVIVDYAHTPDAIERVFESVKDSVRNNDKDKSKNDDKSRSGGHIISIHGGAGRRDPSTREIRGRILAKYSDVVIITEDDSRDESPDVIAADFIKGAEREGKVMNRDLFQIMDRKSAIKKAFDLARPGDLVLILGKGHEKTILRADGPHPFEDAKVAKNLLAK